MGTLPHKQWTVPWHAIPFLVSLMIGAVEVATVGYRPLHAMVAHVLTARAIEEWTVLEKASANDRLAALFEVAQDALRLDPYNADAMKICAYCFSSEGNYDASIPYLKRLVTYYPLDWFFRDQLAEAYQQTGQWRHAQEECRTTISNDFQQPDPHLRMARIAEHLGDGSSCLASTLDYIAPTSDMNDKLNALDELSGTASGRSAQSTLVIGRPAGYGRQSSAAIGEDGTLHFLAMTADDRALVYGRSQDMGQSWNSKQLVCYGENLEGVIAIDQSGAGRLVHKCLNPPGFSA